MVHGPHLRPCRIFADDCEECVERSSTIEGLMWLDSTNILKLGDLAEEVRSSAPHLVSPPMSDADIRAVENLRLAGRIVYRSGITEEVAR